MPKSAQRQSTTDRHTFGDTSLAMFDGCTSLCLLLKVTTFPGSLFCLPVLLFGSSPGSCSLSHMTCVLKPLTLVPPLMRLQNTHVIMSIDFHCGLVGRPQSKVAFVRLVGEQELVHGLGFVVSSHVEEVRKK